MFGIDPMKLVRTELLKLDKLGKPGVPDALEALDAAEATLESLASFFDHIDADDALAILGFFNGLLKNKRPDVELQEAAAALASLPLALRNLKGTLETLEAELTAHK